MDLTCAKAAQLPKTQNGSGSPEAEVALMSLLLCGEQVQVLASSSLK